ncbi:MAG: hypothetical protein ACR2PR_08020 [Pseudohongiellaceae bacterium]
MSKDEKPVPRCFLYSEACPQGQIFEGDAIARAEEAGWQDSPEGLEAAVSDGADPGANLAPLADEERQAMQDELADTQDNLDTVTDALEAAQTKVAEQAEALTNAEKVNGDQATQIKSLTSKLAAAQKKAK